MRNRLTRRKIGVRLQLATAVTLVALVLLLIGVRAMESRRLYDARVNLLQSIDQSATAIATAYQSEEAAGV
jgi:phosphoglycerate-specific signal transduction histidine kinase